MAASLRLWPLHPLESRLAWLTFYPAVMVAAVLGGVRAGIAATALACFAVVVGWPLIAPQPFIATPADWLGLAVFVGTSAMISLLAEAMRRANARSRQAQLAAEDANRAKSRFLAAMSHELRTPLNAILGFSRLLGDDPSMAPEQRQTVSMITSSGEYLLSLINQVLDVASIEAGRLRRLDSVTDVRGLVQEVVDLMTPTAERRSLHLSASVGSGVPRFIVTDSIKLRQILLNLVGNAVKFTAVGGVSIRVTAGPSDVDAATRGEVLALEIADTGPGIPASELGRVFEPFYQVGVGPSADGTGLGLSLVKTYADLLGGSVSVVSRPGEGCTFRVEVPFERAAPTLACTTPPPKGVVRLVGGSPAPRVLIVDDQEMNAMLLSRILQRTGFEVAVASSGAQAIEAFEAWRPAAIFMDVRMPGMGGEEATRRIRSSPDGGRVKIIAATASVLPDEREAVLASGMDDFLPKPYRPEDLYACLTRQLGVTLEPSAPEAEAAT